MQFNSFIFILLFLPLTVFLYFIGNRICTKVGKVILVLAGIVFYGYSSCKMLIVIGCSLALNYLFVRVIRKSGRFKKAFLAVPVVINIGLLFYFKYLNFAIENINMAFGTSFLPQEILLPVGISFYTFQQIAYIVTVYRTEIVEKMPHKPCEMGVFGQAGGLDYLVYILYFPKLLMGPLMEPVDFLEQVNDPAKKRVDWNNIASGLQIFSLGLFKKVMIADVFAKSVKWGFNNLEVATAMDMILVMLFYTFEIYFDFSGYSDMAVGASQMLNITLPINFDSPYKAISIRDFWKRWHISLTRFFTNYVYIPLGGSRKGIIFTCINTAIVFLLSGIWHGANWTFILWGVLHGAFSIFERLFDKYLSRIFVVARWMSTFAIVNVLWLLFRADSLSQWKYIVKKIIFLQDLNVSDGLIDNFTLQEKTFVVNLLHLNNDIEYIIRGFWMWIYLLAALGISLLFENNYRRQNDHSAVTAIISAVAFVWGFICLSSVSVFVYFNF